MGRVQEACRGVHMRVHSERKLQREPDARWLALHASLNCPAGSATPSDLIASIKSQVGYILGVSNLINMSYMVGFGNGGNYPKQIHHRGASMISIKKDAIPVTCKGGFEEWFHKNAPNPNVLDGAVVSPQL
ncbi:unnamed protein product [Prunus armeniaca]|uniref:cellulase n=1 Tax=Prunus armeniaca TaxID=36596 RepID=A0A6J5TMS1_PRUAR|nr:unnamed protein product [Prunus armeniaca]